MTTNPDTHLMTARELGALGVATAAVTLAVGVTLAVLAGHVQLADPAVSAASEPMPAAASVEPESAPSPRVVLVPVERAPVSPDTASRENAPEPVPRTERGDDDREEADEDGHEGHERAEHHERRRGRHHESFWGDDEEEGFDG